MNEKISLTAIILTYNEEIHLQRCLDSLKYICEKIIVVDSFSNDETKNIAVRNKVEFYQNPWKNHAVQFNWALDNCNISTDWVIRVDADEYLLPNLIKELELKLISLDNDVNGVEVYLKRVFMGKHMKHGLGSIKMMRIFRFGKARIENRWMDEHAVLTEGDSIVFNGEFADDNLNTISWWTTKHNSYSIREAIELLDIEFDLLGGDKKTNLTVQAQRKRDLKLKYVKSPLFIRSFFYFIYRYIIRMGFRDGKEGFLWHFLQGWWYRTLVDAKIFEIKKACGSDVSLMKDYIKKNYKIELD
ncbi:glycosyltransferase family 2 protein [Flavicella marina]|uniref:glycosyltransferase family 2 protein n=1 Tax=Flavicella marina TaxID=1475951 RepID=UPI0012658269|nr:glycosyltransferase family 2 protein [Flavicella marina]